MLGVSYCMVYIQRKYTWFLSRRVVALVRCNYPETYSTSAPFISRLSFKLCDIGPSGISYRDTYFINLTNLTYKARPLMEQMSPGVSVPRRVCVSCGGGIVLQCDSKKAETPYKMRQFRIKRT